MQKNVLDYPKLEHYDEWLFDLYQLRIDQKYSMLVYSIWMNYSSISVKKDKNFGFFNLAIEGLHNKLKEGVSICGNYMLLPALTYLSN